MTDTKTEIDQYIETIMPYIDDVVLALGNEILNKNIRFLEYRDIQTILNKLKAISHVDCRLFAPGFQPEVSQYLGTVAKSLARKDECYIRDGVIGEMESFRWFCAALLGNAQYNLAGKSDLNAKLESCMPSNFDYFFKIVEMNSNNVYKFLYGGNILGKRTAGCMGLLLLIIPILGIFSLYNYL